MSAQNRTSAAPDREISRLRTLGRSVVTHGDRGWAARDAAWAIEAYGSARMADFGRCADP